MDVEIKLGTTGNAPPSVTSSSLVGDSGATALLTTVATNNCTLGSDLPNSVRIDLSGIGGSSTQAMYDDGTHGDVAGLNNTWSFSTTLPVVPGVYVLPGVATNSFGVSSNFTITAVVRGSVQLVVISQVNGTGLVQGSWAGPNVNFVEVHNTGSAAADMSGYAVQSGYYDSYYGTT
jgi:hypothetical protein